MRKIVQNPETGERYVSTPSSEWTTRLDAWKADRQVWHVRLEPIARRAARRGRWALYNAAKRAAYARALPCPMPAGHVMFLKGSRYVEVSS